jgi:hypothetical protein
MKKGEASSLFAKSWRWHLRSNKKKEQAPLLPKVGDGVAKATKKNQKIGSLIPILSRLGDGTQELAKKTEKKEQGPPLPELGNGIRLHP